MGLKKYSVLVGPDEIEVVTASKTLEELGVTLYANLKCLTLIPASVGIFWADGEATAGVNPLPSKGVEIKTTKTMASTREFVVASGTIKMQVVQEGGGG